MLSKKKSSMHTKKKKKKISMTFKWELDYGERAKAWFTIARFIYY